MGYQDKEFINIFNFLEAVEGGQERENALRLRQMLKQDQGLPLFRAAQIDAIYQNLDIEPQIKLEYDRFGPSLFH